MDPPVPIPNTVVKRPSADDTALVTEWENRSPPGFITPMALGSVAAITLFGPLVSLSPLEFDFRTIMSGSVVQPLGAKPIKQFDMPNASQHLYTTF